jgi:hypothetical protein
MSERYLFVTGKLAAPALRDTLERAKLPFEYDVAVMKITVAALMTPDWIAKRVEVPDGVTRIMIPGLCQGEVEAISERLGIPAEKGPADLKRLPAFFGQADARSRYGARDIKVFAEINNVARLDHAQIVAAASYYRDEGADVIDLGLALEPKWLDEGPEVIADLKRHGFTLSIDTLDPEQILMADAAGVDYVLSVNGGNRDIAEQLRATPILIPDTPEDLDSLDATIAHLRDLGKPFPRRPDHRTDRVRLRREPRPLPGGPPSPSRRRDADGRRQPDRAHRGRHDGRHGDADRVLPGGRDPQRPHHRGHQLGARRGARDGSRGQAHVLRPAGRNGAQARGRRAADDQGRGVPPVHRVRAA